MEAELVALSDRAGRGINLRNFLAGQGYGEVPLLMYQDNLSKQWPEEEDLHQRDQEISISDTSGFVNA